jgi:hypothetical protein
MFNPTPKFPLHVQTWRGSVKNVLTMGKLPLIIFPLLFILILTDLLLFISGLNRFELGGTRIIILPLFYTYSWILILACFAVLIIFFVHRLFFIEWNRRSGGLLFSLFSLLVLGGMLSAVTSLGLLHRAVYIDSAAFHGDRYYLIRQYYFDSDGWSLEILCRTRKYSFRAECDLPLERNFDNEVLEYRGLDSSDSEGLQIVTEQGSYTVVDRCSTTISLEDSDCCSGKPLFCPDFIILN